MRVNSMTCGWIGRPLLLASLTLDGTSDMAAELPRLRAWAGQSPSANPLNALEHFEFEPVTMQY